MINVNFLILFLLYFYFVSFYSVQHHCPVLYAALYKFILWLCLEAMHVVSL